MTDCGTTDYYLAMVKGKLLQSVPDLQIIDVCHDSKITRDEAQSTFILKNTVPQFPKGTIHIVAMNAHVSMTNRFVAFEHDGQIFIGADSGIFFTFLGVQPSKVYDITYYFKGLSSFALMDVFVPVALELIQGKKLHEISSFEIKLMEITSPLPLTTPNKIIASIIYIDQDGNLITNLSKSYFEEIRKNREFVITMRSKYKISTIDESYSNAKDHGDLIVFFNYSGMLELSILYGNCSELLGIILRDTITIDFKS